ncbi:MAG: RagB/SusD family nutrient uptake outer membrane protein [Bacteroidota bacterium]
MKDIISKIFLIGIITLGSCTELDLLPEDAYGENVLSDPKATNLIINKAYRELAMYEYFGRDYIYCSDLISDDSEYIEGEILNVDRLALEFMANTVANEHSERPYEWAYRSISVCNRVLDIATEDNPFAIGQALFLRAFNYYVLARTYGGVPLILTQELSVEELSTVTRNSLTEVYDQAVADLNRVIDSELLPEKWIEEEQGRATIWAAHGILAKIYLTMASPGIDYNGDKRTLYQKALDHAKFVRDNSPHTLAENYQDLFHPDTEYSNPETIFQTGCNGIDANKGGVPGRYTTNYNPIDRVGWEKGWGNNVPEWRLYESFDDADQRKAVGFVTYFITDRNLTRERYERLSYDEYQPTGDVQNFNPGDTVFYPYWEVPRIQRPHCGKYRFYGSNFNAESNVDENNFNLLRFAEILFIIAECENELGNQSAAIDALNQIIRRAYRGDASYDVSTMSQEAFLERLQHEKWKEHHHECIRWWDLVRWDIFQERMNEFDRFPEAKHRYHPIPQKEIDRNPNLAQNPGW